MALVSLSCSISTAPGPSFMVLHAFAELVGVSDPNQCVNIRAADNLTFGQVLVVCMDQHLSGFRHLQNLGMLPSLLDFVTLLGYWVVHWALLFVLPSSILL